VLVYSLRDELEDVNHIIMPDLQFSITTFGSQKAEKKALLLHGLMGTGAVFFKVADKLVKDGYVSAVPRIMVDSHSVWIVQTY
jgi:esterase/lipase